MNSIKIKTQNSQETIMLGQNLSSLLPNGSVICLIGDLGAGKTTLIRGLAFGLGIKEIIQSPTFNIMKIYLKGSKPLIHIDAYRLADINSDIGLEEYIGYETGITAIEWPMYIEKYIPKNHILIEIKYLNNDQREIIISMEDKDILNRIKL